MPSLTLEDRILELCVKVVETKDSNELASVLSELRATLQEQSARMRGMIADVLARTLTAKAHLN
jgi:uncharacterized coiled-coil protein SlyX